MTVVVRISHLEAKLVRAGLRPLVFAVRRWWGDERDPLLDRLAQILARVLAICDGKTGLLRLGARDLVALQFAVRIGREMLRHRRAQPFIERQTERAGRLIAKLERYRKRIIRLGRTRPNWQETAYEGWHCFRLRVRGSICFGRRPSTPGISLRRLVGARKLRRLRSLVEQYGDQIWQLADNDHRQ